MCFSCESQFQPYQGTETQGKKKEKRRNGSLFCLGRSNPRHPLTFIPRVSFKGSLGTLPVPQQAGATGPALFWELCLPFQGHDPFPCQHPRLLRARDHPSPLDDNSFQRQTRLPTAIVLWLSAYLSPSLFLLPLEALNFG